MNHDATLMYRYKKKAEKPYFPSYSFKTGILDLMASALSETSVFGFIFIVVALGFLT